MLLTLKKEGSKSDCTFFLLEDDEEEAIEDETPQNFEGEGEGNLAPKFQGVLCSCFHSTASNRIKSKHIILGQLALATCPRHK